MAITFGFSAENRAISSEEARWLLGQVRTARELAPAAAAVAKRIERALEEGGLVETTLLERRELIEALERGGAKPRSHELRSLEIELHTSVYAETYLADE